MEFETNFGGMVAERADRPNGAFRDLRVWHEAKTLAVEIYKVSRIGSLAKDYGLREQMRRAAVSVSSNIAEGDERGSNRDAVRFLYIAKGSLAELRTQVEIASEIGYLNAQTARDLDKDCMTIAKMLGALIRTRTATYS
jgi:four helix bundle protein